MIEIPKDAEYLGDGVYMWSDGYHIWLGTYDGYGVTNKIAMDSHVLAAFKRKLEDMENDT